MKILFCNENDKDYQYKLNNFLSPIFLDFSFWYNLNLWDSNYESYSIMQNEEIVSNICIYKANILFKNRQYMALSVGAVATKYEHRGKGYARFIMEHIIEKYPDMPMYLSANETVTGFYPRFAFERVIEKLPVAQFKVHNDIKARKIRFDNPVIWNYIYNRINYSSELDCLNTESINLFHIYWGYLHDCIYEIPELKTLIVARQNKTVLKIISVYSLKDISFQDLANQLPFQHVSLIEFGFMPYWNDLEYEMRFYDTDPLFVRGIKCELGDFKFPELSIT